MLNTEFFSNAILICLNSKKHASYEKIFYYSIVNIKRIKSNQ